MTRLGEATSAKPGAHDTVPHEPRVLMAEDESDIALLVAESLEDAGFHVTWACDGVKALDEAGHAQFDALLTDVRMPNLDGVGLVRAVRAGTPWLPVVVLSGYMTALDRQALLQLGVPEERMLEKPVSLSRVCEALRLALKQTAATC